MPDFMVELVHQHKSRLQCALPGSGKTSVRIFRPTSHCACQRCGPIVPGVQGGNRTIPGETLVDGDEILLVRGSTTECAGFGRSLEYWSYAGR